MALSTSDFGSSTEEFFRASPVKLLQAALSSHEKAFPNILLDPSKLQFLAVAPRYIIWHYQEEFGSVIFLIALQVLVGSNL